MSGLPPGAPAGAADDPLGQMEAEAALRALCEPPPADLAGPLAMALAAMAGSCRTPEGPPDTADLRYRALVEQIPAITFLAALHGDARELYVSPQIEEVLGFSQKEWLEDPVLWFQRLHPDDRERWHAEFARTVACGVPFRSEYRFLARDGRVVWVRGEARIVRDAGGIPLFLQGIAFDITDQEEAEAILRRSRESLEEEVQHRTRELAEANRALQAEVAERQRAEAALLEAKDAAESASTLKGEFLANMSHEIRTPMNGIISMAELALGTRLDPVQREYLETVKASADTLLTVINDVLDFSKIEADKLELDSIAFGLRDAMAEALKPMAVHANEKGLELACEVDDNVPDVVTGDPSRLKQVVINLVGNAIKFTLAGEVVVQARRITAGRDLGHLLRFSISDTGIGIPADKQQRIFEPFTQADGSMTRRFGGTGLGLAISRRLVELMGGRIWLESRPGAGTTFHFTAWLPGCPAASNASGPDRADDLRGVRVLIVDDNATSRRILEQAATAWGMAPTPCESGRAALEAIATARVAGRPYPLVLLDAAMPETDGFEVIRRVDAGALPVGAIIVMLASVAQLSRLVSVRGVEPGRFLIKPIRRSELRDAFRRGLSDAAEPRGAPEPQPAPPDPAGPGSLRILLVEDHLVNQKVAVRLLERHGHSVVVAGDGRQALDRLEGGGFDLVLMDLQMPVMDGFEAVAAIRAREATTGGHIPMIALTAHAMKGDRERCLRAGFDEHVTKPIRWPQLAPAIAGLVRPRPRSDSPKRVDASPPVIFGAATALERLGGALDLFREVAAIFLDDGPRTIAQVADAVDRGDARALKVAAHGLKGYVASFAAPTVEELAVRLESMGTAGDLAAAPEVFADLRRALDQLRTSLVDFLETGAVARPPGAGSR